MKALLRKPREIINDLIGKEHYLQNDQIFNA